MANINLLPWREARRKQRTQEFYVILAGSALLGGLLFFAASSMLDRQMEAQDERNRILQDEIAALDRKIQRIQELDEKRNRLLARKEVIEDLQKNRAQIVHLFEQLVVTVPDGVRLDAIKQQGDRLTLDGRAESNSQVSSYMENLDESGWLKNPNLVVVEERAPREGQTQRMGFQLNVTVGRDAKADEEELAEGDDTGSAGP